MKNLSRRIRQMLNVKKWNNQMRRALTAVACVVVFMTTYALILPAITLEKGELICGLEVHEHTDSCYEDVLVCSILESPGHIHTDE